MLFRLVDFRIFWLVEKIVGIKFYLRVFLGFIVEFLMKIVKCDGKFYKDYGNSDSKVSLLY